MPDSVLESIRRTDVALKAPITTPVGTGFRSVNVYLRQALDLYACVRPCKHYQGVRTTFDGHNVDLVIVRENTEDLYAGIEFEDGKPETAELIADIKRLNGKTIRPDSGISIKPISVDRHASGSSSTPSSTPASTAARRSPAVHKANILKFSDGLFLKTAARSPRTTPTSSSRTGSSTTCACSSCRSPSCTTCSSCRTSTATSSPTSAPGWSAAWASPRARTSATRARSSRPPTARPRSTRARTRSTRPP